MCDTGSSISFVNKSIVSRLQLQGRKPSLSITGIHGSQDVKTENSADSGFSTREVSTIDDSAILYVHEKLKLGDQIVDLQGLKDRYTHLKKLSSQSYNLNEVQVILGQDCYDIHHLLEPIRIQEVSQ